MVDEIETRVEATASAVEQGVSELTQANKNAAAARRKKWMVFWIVILVLVIIAIIIAVYIGGQKKTWKIHILLFNLRFLHHICHIDPLQFLPSYFENILYFEVCMGNSNKRC